MEGVFNGAVIFTALLSALIALPLTHWMLNGYRKSVLALMGKNSDSREYIPETGDRSGQVQFRLEFVSDQPKTPLWAGNTLIKLSHRALFIYGLGLAAFAFLNTALVLESDGIEWLPGRFFTVWIIAFWPFLLILPWIGGVTGRTWLWFLLVYVLLFTIPGLLLIDEAPLIQLLIIFLFFNGVPTLLVTILLSPRLRAAGMMVLSLTTLGVGGAVGLPLLFQEETALKGAWFFFGLFGSETAEDLMGAVVITGIVLGLVGAWILIRVYRKLYVLQIVSDKSIIADAIVLYFGIWTGLVLSSKGPVWLLLCLGVFLVYKLLVWLLLRVGVQSAVCALPVKELLLLRVFHQKDSADLLFRNLSRYWRLQGPVHMIAGPDLAHCTVEPHEFLDYISGRLDRQFMKTPAEIDQKIAAVDIRPAADGNYAVYDFFCYNNNWKYALGQLTNRVQQVVMDLRNFSPQRSGCIYEIKTLLKVAPAEKILFVIDATTDQPFFESVLSEACSKLPADSPNVASAQSITIRCFFMQKGGNQIEKLVHFLS